MRRLIALLVLIASPIVASVQAQSVDPVRGLWLLTDYPSQTVRAGEVANVRFKLQNTGLAPEPLALSLSGVPDGWKIDILGGGQPVASAMANQNESVALQLRVDVPKDAKPGSQSIVVRAKGQLVAIEQTGDYEFGQPDHAGAAGLLGRMQQTRIPFGS